MDCNDVVAAMGIQTILANVAIGVIETLGASVHFGMHSHEGF